MSIILVWIISLKRSNNEIPVLRSREGLAGDSERIATPEKAEVLNALGAVASLVPRGLNVVVVLYLLAVEHNRAH